MKIGFVFDDSLDRSDGVQQYIKTLGPWMKSQGHDVVYLCGETKIIDWQGCKVYSMTKNVNVKFNANRLSIPRPTSNRYIKSVLNEEKFDVLHVQMPHSPLMSQKVIKLADSKTVIFGTFHILPAGKLQHLGSKALSLWYGKSIQIFDKIVAVSPAASDFAATAFKIRASVLPNAVDTKKFSLVIKNKTITDKKTIVFLGRLVKRKGAAELLKAYKILQTKHKNIQLKIAGDGPDRDKLQKFAKSNDLKNVEFLGFIDEDYKPQLLANADIAVYPSLYGESFGIVLVEAMASGSKIVLGGNNPGYASVLNRKQLLDPTDTISFAEDLYKYLTDQVLIAQTNHEQQHEYQQYDVGVIGLKLLKQYQQLLAAKRNL